MGVKLFEKFAQRRIERHRREQAIRDEWRQRKQAVLADPLGLVLWGAMAYRHLTIGSRNPVFAWQIERAYTLVIEDVLADPRRDPAITERDRTRRLLNRVYAAISHHEASVGFREVWDDALYAARDKVLADDHAGRG